MPGCRQVTVGAGVASCLSTPGNQQSEQENATTEQPSGSEQARAQRGGSTAEQLWLPMVKCPLDPAVRCLHRWLGRQGTELAWLSGASPQCWRLKDL